MKYVAALSFGFLLFSASQLLAGERSLEGQTFSRSFETTPMGAHAPMNFTHSLVFGADWTVTDSANTWFGNPPSHCAYGLKYKGKKQEQLDRVTVICNGYVSRYKFVKEDESEQLHLGKQVLTRAN